MLNDEWCRFFKDNNWLVGISIDGPEDLLHDYYRKSYSGRSFFNEVMRGIELLNRYGVWLPSITIMLNICMSFINFLKYRMLVHSIYSRS